MNAVAQIGPAQRPRPPVNQEAEQAVIGSVMFSNRVYDDVAEIVKANDFAVPVNRRIWSAIEYHVLNRIEANPTTLKAYFEDDEEIAHVGGHRYLVGIMAESVSVTDARSYARTVRDLARRRDLMAISEDLADAAAAPKFDVSADDIALKASGEIERVMGDGEDGGPQDMATTVAQALRTLDDARKDDGAALAIPTGIAELDHQIGGLAVSEVSVLGARPGMGKTAVAAQIALNVALSSRPVLFFSLEMAADQIMHRLICGEANINSSRPHMRGMTAIERQAYTETANRLSSAPLFIDTHAEAVSQIVARSQAWHRAGRCSLVVIDYLGLIQPDDRYKGNKVYELAEITRALKTRIANRLHVPVLLLAQLNRGVEGRDDKRPTLADLRDSGAIEQDAGLVMFLFREAYYLERKLERTPGEEADLQASRTELEIIIAKNRHGPANREARTTFDPSTTRVGRRQESMDFGEEVPV